jgi:hypothetical protein
LILGLDNGSIYLQLVGADGAGVKEVMNKSKLPMKQKWSPFLIQELMFHFVPEDSQAANIGPPPTVPCARRKCPET